MLIRKKTCSLKFHKNQLITELCVDKYVHFFVKQSFILPNLTQLVFNISINIRAQYSYRQL